MDGNKERRFDNGNLHGGDDDGDLRRGPWTVEEDMTLINYIANHGDGRWNSLARCAGNGFLAGTLTYSDSSVSEFIVRAFFFFFIDVEIGKLIHRPEAYRKKLPIAVAELSPAGRPARKYYTRRTAPDSGTSLPLGKSVRMLILLI